MCWVSKCFYQHDIWKAEDRTTSWGFGKHRPQWSQGSRSLYIRWGQECSHRAVTHPNRLGVMPYHLTPFKIAVSNPLLDASTCLDTACICQETKSQPCWVVVHQASLITSLHFKGKQNLLQSFLRFRNGWIQKNWLEKFIKIKYAMHSLETARPSVLRS